MQLAWNVLVLLLQTVFPVNQHLLLLSYIIVDWDLVMRVVHWEQNNMDKVA